MSSTSSKINERQNEDWNLKLLAAQRQLYSEAKVRHDIRLYFGIGVALGGFVFAIIFPQLVWIKTVMGAFALAVERMLALEEKNRRRSAATIQEQLDTNVLQLPWRAIVVGERVDAEDVSAAQARFRGDRRGLRNWYPDVSRIPRPLAVLICQRANLRWDVVLRLSFANAVRWSLVALVRVPIVVALLLNWSLQETLSTYAPMVSAFFIGFDTVRSHRDHANAQGDLKQRIEALWESGLREPGSVGIEDLRTIQDCMYRLRVTAPPVPDKWYRRHRDQYEQDMAVATAQMIREARVPRSVDRRSQPSPVG